MDIFDAYEKYIKPDDDAMKQALIAGQAKEDDKLWDNGTDGNEKPQETKEPGTLPDPSPLKLSDEQMQQIIAGVIAGMKGGDGDGNAGHDKPDAE